MNGALLAPVAALLSVVLWLASRRRSVPLLPHTGAEGVAALNRAQITLVQQQAAAVTAAVEAVALSPLPRPGDARQRQALLAQLRGQLAGDQPQRLAAIRQAGRWGDRATLPLLHRGLRDVDLAVRAEAARAMERFRGRSAVLGLPPVSAQLALPRNVARTR